MDKAAKKLVLDYQNDKQSIRLGAETNEDRVDEERIRMLKANELLEQDFLKLQEANDLEFEAQEMDEKEKDILWRKNNQLRRVRKKDFTEKELERIQERIKKISFDELDEVANQQKIQAELKNVKTSTNVLREKYDVLPDITSKLSEEKEDDALDNAKYKLLAKNAVLSAKNEIRKDELMLKQKINQQEEITKVKELQILESKIEMEKKILESLKLKLAEYDNKNNSLDKTNEDLELTLDDALRIADTTFIAVSLSREDGILWDLSKEIENLLKRDEGFRSNFDEKDAEDLAEQILSLLNEQ